MSVTEGTSCKVCGNPLCWLTVFAEIYNFLKTRLFSKSVLPRLFHSHLWRDIIPKDCSCEIRGEFSPCEPLYPLVTPLPHCCAQDRLVCLNTGTTAGGTVLECCGIFERPALPGGGGSPVIHELHFLPYLFLILPEENKQPHGLSCHLPSIWSHQRQSNKCST